MGYHMDRRPAHDVMALPEEVTKDWDFEVINPVLFERNRERTIEDVLDQLQQVYGELVNKLEATPFEDLLKPRHADDPEKRPLLMWVLGDTTEHFLEHRETIEKMHAIGLVREWPVFADDRVSMIQRRLETRLDESRADGRSALQRGPPRTAFARDE